MSSEGTPVNSRKGLKIDDETKQLYEQRDKSLDNGPDTRPLPPEKWSMRRDEFFRPIKRLITTRIDADVLAWLQFEGEGYQTRMNAILRKAMEQELKQNAQR